MNIVLSIIGSVLLTTGCGIAWCLIVAGLALLFIQAGWHFGNQWLQQIFPTTTRY